MMVGLVRSVALFLSFSFGVIAMSVGINALVKAINLKDFVKSHAPAGVTVDIDTHEAFSTGIVATVGCGMLAITSLVTMLFGALRPRARKAHFISPLFHLFWVVWIFASLVAFDVIARNGEAKIAAFIGGSQLPDSIVQQQEQAMGVSAVYWDHDYMKLLAILPWFTILFGTIAGVILLRAPKDNISRSATHSDAEGGPLRKEEGDKTSIEKKRESVENA